MPPYLQHYLPKHSLFSALQYIDTFMNLEMIRIWISRIYNEAIRLYGMFLQSDLLNTGKSSFGGTWLDTFYIDSRKVLTKR